MDDTELEYIQISIKEMVNECKDLSLLYLINSLLREDAIQQRPFFAIHLQVHKINQEKDGFLLKEDKINH